MLTLVGTQFAKAPGKLFYHSSKYLSIRKTGFCYLKVKFKNRFLPTLIVFSGSRKIILTPF